MWKGPFALSAVEVALGDRDAIRGLETTVAEREFVVVVGPNGAGKTTLLRTMAGLVVPRSGTVRCFGIDPATTDRRSVAGHVAYLPQNYEVAFPFAVEELVLLGRYAKQRGLGLPSHDDIEAATAAMTTCDIGHLAQRRFDELSGGEARRVLLAQALCQGARCLLLDEPTAGLDPAHARSVFAMVREQCDAGRAAVMATHDLDLALRFGGTMWLIDNGALTAVGPPRDVLAGAEARAAFGMAIHVGTLPSGQPFAVPQ